MNTPTFLTGLSPLQSRLAEVCRSLAENENVFVSAKDVLSVIACDDGEMDEETFEEECEELSCDVKTIDHYNLESVGYLYRLLLQMGQPWRNRYPLIDLAGISGDFFDEQPFGPESVEVRYSKNANILFVEDKPPLLPISLLNGLILPDGSAVPSHHLEELWMGMEHLRQEPDLPLSELMEVIPGPDFGMGGIVGGFDEIYDFYKKGEAHLSVRGQIDTILDGGRTRVAIRSLPHGVLLKPVLQQINALQEKDTCPPFILKRNPDGTALNIIIDMGPQISADKLKTLLYQETDLEQTIHLRCGFKDNAGWMLEGPLITVLKEANTQCSTAWTQKNGTKLDYAPFIRDVIKFGKFKNPLYRLVDERRTTLLRSKPS
ncbi:MAG: hypothetical protein GXO96_07445 [Nitrospirae bacterium]|nr:hypothetical protein [Candidatus Manganitrophaceae bacterium]